MNIDVLATDSHIIVNKRLAEIFGISEAVYLSELFNISKKAVNKKSFDPETGYFTLARKYIEKQTTIKPTQQCEFDQKFQQAGILEVSETNIDMIRIDTSKVISLITCQDVKVLAAVVNQAKTDKETKKETKRNAIIQMLKNSIKTADQQVRAALENWVSVVYDKGMCKKAQVEVFENQLNLYTANSATQLAIINICIAQGYKNCDFGIQIYEKTKPTESRVRSAQQKVATELDTVNIF